MNIDFDPASFVLALFAIWLAIHESRKSNKVILTIRECRHSRQTSINENAAQGFFQFTVLLVNHGISLHDLEVLLVFTGESGVDRWTIPMRNVNASRGTHNEFAKGMIADFRLKSYQMSQGDIDCLQTVKDPTRQNAWLHIRGGYRDRLRSMWNTVAFKINGQFVTTQPGIRRSPEVAPRGAGNEARGQH